jgi:hypothetical protein
LIAARWSRCVLPQAGGSSRAALLIIPYCRVVTGLSQGQRTLSLSNE